jgi:hypothetical protein
VLQAKAEDFNYHVARTSGTDNFAAAQISRHISVGTLWPVIFQSMCRGPRNKQVGVGCNCFLVMTSDQTGVMAVAPDQPGLNPGGEAIRKINWLDLTWEGKPKEVHVLFPALVHMQKESQHHHFFTCMCGN